MNLVTTDGPLLESLTRRLAECPAEFLLAPRAGATTADGIDVVAIACDQLRAMGADVTEIMANQIRPHCFPAGAARMLSLAAWLLHDDWFLAHRELAGGMIVLFTEGFGELAGLVKAEDLINDPDRREEFARLCLKRLGLRPQGESASESADRLNSLDSAERVRVARGMRDAEARARKIREQMARKAAEAAAARYTPE